ncbi:uncharacterized protein LOC62_07G009453 [Vanrija pseudolonga]|uniref:Uncharacterized protein n=1 Tax=Vanrija pseudolonga TaxID=143232 RepID=A0AAF1BRK4_9TREE|nr:hypothetical protein LOC62_07G009453 [Vanrija pseudolonga]
MSVTLPPPPNRSPLPPRSPLPARRPLTNRELIEREVERQLHSMAWGYEPSDPLDLAGSTAKEFITAFGTLLVVHSDRFEAIVKRRAEAEKAKGTIPASRVQTFDSVMRRQVVQHFYSLIATLPGYVSHLHSILLHHVWREDGLDPILAQLDALDVKYECDLEESAQHFVCRLNNRISKFTGRDGRERDVGHRVGQTQRTKATSSKGEHRVEPYERARAKKYEGGLLDRIAARGEENMDLDDMVGDLLGRIAPLDNDNLGSQPNGGELLGRIAPLRDGGDHMAAQPKVGGLLGRITPLGDGNKVLQPKTPNGRRGPKVGPKAYKAEGEAPVDA